MAQSPSSPHAYEHVSRSTAPSASQFDLDTASATKLPPSSPVQHDARSPGTAKLRRTPSSSSLASSQSTRPLIQKRASLGSLHGAPSRTPPRSPASLSRRVSSNLLVVDEASHSGGMSTREADQPKPISSADVAKEYLLRDLQSQELPLDSHPALTVVLHDACYGHRYSRPRTSKAALSTVVERPERILAALLGISAAYVRLGQRHEDGNNAPHPGRPVGLAPFAIKKSTRALSLVSPVVTQVHGTKWMAELKMMCEGAEAKLASTGKELSRPSTSARDGSPEKHLHEGDLYLCAESLDAIQGALGGVVDAVDAVFAPWGPQRAFACVRPPGHHCSADYPSGFCWINNVHVGIAHAAAEHGLTHAAIIDFDLHHGDGSQAITWEHNAGLASLPKNASAAKKYAIGYFSIHDINSYPCEWGDPEKVRNASLCLEGAHGQTIWNVHLQSWKTNAEFWALYESRYVVLLDKVRNFLRAHNEKLHSQSQARAPKAAILISAGLDASEWEGEGMQRHKVNVPTDFYARFTQDIVSLSCEPGLAAEGRIVSVLEGGYSDRALMTGIFSHLCGLAEKPAVSQHTVAQGGLAHDLSMRMGQLAVEDPKEASDGPAEPVSFCTSWWAPARLEELERLVNPQPAHAPRKPRGPVAPTYVSHTQSSVAKAVSPDAARRSSSNPLANGFPSPNTAIRVPNVSWELAASELAKLLTPTDRETRSCRPEDLNADATRARKNGQSAVGVVREGTAEGDARMQLRDRKVKPAPLANAPGPRAGKAVANRRRTVSGAADLMEADPAPLESSVAHQKPALRRRVSAASTLVSVPDDAPPDLANAGSTSTVPTAPILSQKPRGTKKPGPKPATSLNAFRAKLSVKAKPDLNKQSSNQAIKAATSEPDLEALTTGVKKMSIKLNVPTREEHDRREAERKVPSKIAKRTLAPKPAKPPAGAPPTSASPKSETIRQTNYGLSAAASQPDATPSAHFSNETRPPIPHYGQISDDRVPFSSHRGDSSHHQDIMQMPIDDRLDHRPAEEPIRPQTGSKVYTPGSQIVFGPPRTLTTESGRPSQNGVNSAAGQSGSSSLAVLPGAHQDHPVDQ